MLMYTYTKTMNILFLAKSLLISAIRHALSYLYEIEEFKIFFFLSHSELELVMVLFKV